LLTGITNFRWNSDGTASDLLERYFYHDLAITEELGDRDFETANPDYGF
jgi:hypothetical protein